MTVLPNNFRIDLRGDGPAMRYAGKLLEDLGALTSLTPTGADQHPARHWAGSGLMALTGSPPVICPVPLPHCADGALNAFRALAGKTVLAGVTGSQLLVERAASGDYQAAASRSSGEHCRLLATQDGMIALNLARDEDWDSLPAWLSEEQVLTWDSIRALLLTRSSAELVERGRLLGLAVCDALSIPDGPCPWIRLTRGTALPSSRRASLSGQPRVIDLSSLWAGPLCSHLWQAAGAEVVKVESARRPDGSRRGSAEFFDLLNHGKQNVVLDLHEQSGRRELCELIQQADIVLEASRPRALQQMGIIAEDLVRENAGLSWVSITGYGRREPQGNWIAYGDDAAIAAGLSAIIHEVTDRWLICGDAIADPLTGLHAALAGWASWLAGGGQLLELSLVQTVRHCITRTAPVDNDYRARHQRWNRYLQAHRLEPRAPRRRFEGETSAP
ncbi:MAG: CoA transferase [Halioglobus sp.]|nr:CoA transferase [Halioglobus sp.]